MEKSATHLSFTVSNLDQTISFYSKLFQTKPSKVKKNYAKFELEDPAMVISFLQSGITSKNVEWGISGAHFGIRVNSTEEVNQRYDYLRAQGIPVLEEADVACCYAVQDKFWANDPDGIRWEIYTFKEDSESFKQKDSQCCSNPKEGELASCC